MNRGQQENIDLITVIIPFPKERLSSKQVNILILKTILLNWQDMFQSIHTSSSVAKSVIKTVNILNLHIF